MYEAVVYICAKWIYYLNESEIYFSWKEVGMTMEDIRSYKNCRDACLIFYKSVSCSYMSVIIQNKLARIINSRNTSNKNMEKQRESTFRFPKVWISNWPHPDALAIIEECTRIQLQRTRDQWISPLHQLRINSLPRAINFSTLPDPVIAQINFSLFRDLWNGLWNCKFTETAVAYALY